MKTFWNAATQRNEPAANAPTPWDCLLLPDGRRVGDVGHAELGRILDRLRVEGFTPSVGRDALLAAYAKHIRAIHDTAGQKAVTAYLTENAQ